LVAILHLIKLWQESRNITGGAGSSQTGADQCAARKYHETWAAVSDCGLLHQAVKLNRRGNWFSLNKEGVVFATPSRYSGKFKTEPVPERLLDVKTVLVGQTFFTQPPAKRFGNLSFPEQDNSYSFRCYLIIWFHSCSRRVGNKPVHGLISGPS